MKTKKAFTLIEVMVVLSILALVAILAYSYFGSVMKDAKNNQLAIELVSSLQRLNDATELYELNNGTKPPLANLTSVSTLYSGWVMDYLRAESHPPAGSYQSGCSHAHEYRLCTECWNAPNTLSNANDTFTQVNCISDDVCKSINSIYSKNIGYDIYDSLNASVYPLPEENIFCMKVTATRNTAFMIIESR